MDKVKVYKFKKYAVNSDPVALRMATRRFIVDARGTVIRGTETEVDRALIDENGQAAVEIQPET
jgi:hypothetical protein